MKIIKKVKKPIKKKDSYYKNKLDKLIQEKGRLTYKSCLVCGGEMSCLHHYFPKSTSSNLRYNFLNLIPICVGCHLRHHKKGDPRIQNIINKRKGEKWLKELNKEKDKITKIDFKKLYEEFKINLLIK